MITEDLEELQFKLESLLYTKNQKQQKQNVLPVSRFCGANLRFQDKLVSQVKRTN